MTAYLITPIVQRRKAQFIDTTLCIVMELASFLLLLLKLLTQARANNINWLGNQIEGWLASYFDSGDIHIHNAPLLVKNYQSL
jgi:hypothetical protein